MAQSNEIATTGATLLGIESTPGTTPGSMVRVFPRRGGTRSENDSVISSDGMRSALVNRDTAVLGYKTCQSQMTFDARPLAARVNSAASPTRPWQGVPLFGLLGGESVHAGSAVVAGSTTTVINVTATHGARFSPGDGILVTVAGVNEFAVIRSIAADALTLMFALPAVPSVGADVFACTSYFPADANTSTLTFQHARAQNAASQWTHNMCTGSMSIDTPRDGLLSFGVSLNGGNWTGPTAQSIATTEATQTMGPPVANVRAFQLLQPLVTTTRTHVPLESVAFNVDPGMQLVPDVGGTTEGLIGSMRTQFSAGVDLTLRHDDAYRIGWDPGTVYQFVHCVYSGSGATRGCVALVLIGTLSETPGYQSGSNDRGLTSLKLSSIGGQLAPSVNTNQARAPFFWMMG
jgi:hypothetical protein